MTSRHSPSTGKRILFSVAAVVFQIHAADSFALQASFTSMSTSQAGTLPLAATKTDRLSRDEEMELLRQATELRRIQVLESDLAMQSPDLKIPFLSKRAEAAGYGDDIFSYEDAIDQGHRAREALVTRNMGLVHYCVNEVLKKTPKSKLGTLSREDLIQEGAIGLARAVDKYNIGIGGKFSTYAVYWIRAAVLRCIAERGHLVRVPEHVSTAIRKMSAAANRLGVEVDGEHIVNTVVTSHQWREAQTAKALAEEAGLTDRQLREAMRISSQRKAGNVSFEDWMQRGQDLKSDVTTLFDTSVSDSSTLNREKLRKQFSKFLRPKEMEALSLRYGLNVSRKQSYQAEAEALVFGTSAKRGKSGEAMSFSEVGKQMSVSSEYGRKLVHRALAKLKKAAAEGQLEPALLF